MADSDPGPPLPFLDVKVPKGTKAKIIYDMVAGYLSKSTSAVASEPTFFNLVLDTEPQDEIPESATLERDYDLELERHAGMATPDNVEIIIQNGPDVLLTLQVRRGTSANVVFQEVAKILGVPLWMTRTCMSFYLALLDKRVLLHRHYGSDRAAPPGSASSYDWWLIPQNAPHKPRQKKTSSPSKIEDRETSSSDCGLAATVGFFFSKIWATRAPRLTQGPPVIAVIIVSSTL